MRQLVAGRVGYDVLLPKGGWYDTLSGAFIPGGGLLQIAASDDSVRLFARAGAIIPTQPVVRDSDQAPNGALQLDVWPGKGCAGSLYLDDGHSFAFQSGALRRIHYTCEVSTNGIRVVSASQGPFPTWWKATTVLVHGVPREPHSVVDRSGTAIASEYDAAQRSETLHLLGGNAEWSLTLAYSPFGSRRGLLRNVNIRNLNPALFTLRARLLV